MARRFCKVWFDTIGEIPEMVRAHTQQVCMESETADEAVKALHKLSVQWGFNIRQIVFKDKYGGEAVDK